MYKSRYVHAMMIAIVVMLISINSSMALAAQAGETPIQAAWLKQRLPADTLAYKRIPHPLGIFATPKGNALDPALRSPVNTENVRKIQQGVLGNVLPLIPDLDDPRIRFLIGQVESPLELAFFAAPAPSVLLAMHVGLDSVEALEAALAEFAASDPPLALTAPIDAEGHGQLTGLPAPTFLKFDATSGLLLVQVGPAVTAESFRAVLASLAPGANSRMAAIEQQLDQSGQGWFLWIDAEKTLPVAQMFMSPENLAKLQATGLDKVRTAGIGWGVADSKGRLGIVLDVAAEGNRQFLPFVSNNLDLTSVGQPDAVALLSLPTAEELARIESLFLESMEQEDRDEWQKLKDTLKSETGVSIEELFSALGPELVAIFDAAGDYGAIRLRDQALFEQLMDALAASSGMAPDTHRVHGKTFYHWSMPGDLAIMDMEASDQMGPAAEILARQREHIYWVQDGDFLYVASVPQPLFDRVSKGADTRIDLWLKDQQHIDTTSSFLALTGTSRKLPMRLYHIYIELLQLLADLSEADIDVWNMPSASQLSLATQGVVGFTVNLGDPYVSATMTFESNPAEALLGSGGGSIAAIGILAAIAIPAYQDYTARAQVMEGYYLAQQAQDAVATYHATGGEFPPPSIAAAMGEDLTGTYTESIMVMPGSGIIVVNFFAEAIPDGGQLFFEPAVDSQGVIEWVCSGTLPTKHMPEDCRDNEVPEEVHGGA
jgi:hypothetical protein